jgi:hypothetical protein
MVNPKHYHGADNRDEHAPKVEAGDASRTNRTENEAADDRPDNAKDDVEKNALAGAINDFAANEASDQAEYDPPNDRHATLPFVKPKQLSSGCARFLQFQHLR